jgi:hypothetical protein
MVFAFAGDSTMTSERPMFSFVTPDSFAGRPMWRGLCPSRYLNEDAQTGVADSFAVLRGD